MLRNRLAAACVATLSLLLLGCEDSQKFEDILRNDIEVADFERVRLRGGEKLILKVTEVTSDMIHPEFIGRWTNLRREIEVNFYVLPLADFDENKPISELENILFTSVADDGVGFGDRRVTEMHVHPSPGQWVMFFFNPRPGGPSNEAELSADVRLSFFK